MSARLAVLLAAAVAAPVAGCRRGAVTSPSDAGPPPPPPREAPARQPGPPRTETDAQVARARDEARALAAALRAQGISPRQVAAVADTHGFRFFRHRYPRRARAWFEVAVAADPTFELALYNAARAAALAGDAAAARRHLRRLRARGTPLARRLLAQAATDPDLAPLRSRRGR